MPTKTGLRRPLNADAMRRGRDLAARYQAVIWFEDGEYYGHGLEIPGVMEDGKTADECFRKVRESMAECVAPTLEMGQTPPVPQVDVVTKKRAG
ncbi:MAG: type II toxin-antitoxin system HicB family antitoxin [Tepidisphaeraceae bacterium]